VDLNELEEAFEQAEQSEDVSVHLGFKKLLLSSDDPQVIEYHFELLSRSKNKHLHNTLARFFGWRRESGKQYLLARLADETDAHLLATGLQILGGMKCHEAADMARAHLHHEEATVRERACMVLGWVGGADDIPTLGRLQLDEPDVNTRKWAATQQMHIWSRLPDTKIDVLANLLTAIENESDADVLCCIVYTAQQVLKRKFGLKEDRTTRQMVGDLAEAKRKATTAMRNYLKKNKGA
jgi:HEAT repeats